MNWFGCDWNIKTVVFPFNLNEKQSGKKTQQKSTTHSSLPLVDADPIGIWIWLHGIPFDSRTDSQRTRPIFSGNSFSDGLLDGMFCRGKYLLLTALHRFLIETSRENKSDDDSFICYIHCHPPCSFNSWRANSSFFALASFGFPCADGQDSCRWLRKPLLLP